MGGVITPSKRAAYILAQMAVPLVLVPAGVVSAAGTLNIGNANAGSLSFASTAGAGVIVTGTGTTFASTDNGRVITLDGGKQALITSWTNATQVTVTINITLSTTSFANNTWLLGTPLLTAYNTGLWVSLPAGALLTGIGGTALPAGMYWCMGNSTTGMYVTTTYQDPTLPFTPYVPTGAAISAVGSGVAYVQVTGSDVPLCSITIPAGSTGINGGIRATALYAANNNTSTKNPKMFFGSMSFPVFSAALGNWTSVTAISMVKNRGTGAQIATYNSSNGLGVSGSIDYGANDTTINQQLIFAVNSSSYYDFIVLEAITVEILPS